jgi:hypothetical protein
MIKLISTENYIMFLVLKFYRHGYMTKVELHKNSQNYIKRKLFITIKVYLKTIKSKIYLDSSKISQTLETARLL